MSIFLLIDCNNFYASCHRIFNPQLEHHPVVVLSNNDGCIIARSNEAKKLGIPMGAPYFQYQQFCKENRVAVFSSNYELYGDISQRVMTILKGFSQHVEIYSIDEAFLYFDSEPSSPIMDFCLLMRQKIKMWTGMPVSIGMGPTKTLAKAANFIAKRQNLTGIFDLREPRLQNTMLTQIQTSDVWGVGNRFAAKLDKLGVTTALQLRDQPDEQIRSQFGVTLQRTLLELRGTPCLSLENSKPRQNIISSRSFRHTITSLTDLETAISQFIATACGKLRRQNSKAQGIYIFIQTNLFDKKNKPYSNGIFCSFASPTLDTRFIIGAGKYHLRKIYRPGLSYKKAGIMLVNLTDSHVHQEDLFIQTPPVDKSENLMHALDQINDRLGRNAIFIAAQGIQNRRQGFKQNSPCFTTKWAEILTINV
jgi:DNA polymerase V